MRRADLRNPERGPLLGVGIEPLDSMARTLETEAMRGAGLHHERYRDAGVDTDEADAGLRKLTDRISQTWPSPDADGAVQLEIGYFANVINICGLGIAISTDGIGSKAMIASMLGKYDT